MPVGLRKIQAVFAKVESSEGVDAAPGATDAIQLAEPGTIVPGAEMVHARPDLHTQLLAEAAPLPPGAKWGEATFRFYVRGRGAAYATTAGPEVHALIQASAYSAVFNTNLWDYESAPFNQKTVTLDLFQGLDTGVWLKHKLLGAMCSRLSYTARGGGVGFFEAVVRGKYVAPQDASPTGPTYLTSVPPIIGAASAVGLAAFATGKVAEIGSAIENTLGPRISANDPDGLAGFRVVNQRLAWNIALESVPVATYDVFGKWASAVAEALAVAHGTVQFNRFKVDADKATIADVPTYRERNGLIDFAANGICGVDGTNKMRWRFD